MPRPDPTTPLSVGPDDLDGVRGFLTACDLTVAGLGAAGVHLWAVRDADGAIVATTGYERSADGRHALLRSVAVGPSRRGSGIGSRLARFAMAAAVADGAEVAWLFSRRSGPFWQALGFAPADRAELAGALAGTTQVELFRSSGQLDREVAWTRPIGRQSVVPDGSVGA